MKLDAPLLLASLSLFGLLGACSQDEGESNPDKKVLRFSAIPDQDATMLRQKFAPIARYLSEKLGVPVEYDPSTDYTASVEKFKNGDIQLAWFGGYTGYQARYFVKDARAIVCGEADKRFVSYFIAHKDSGLEASDDFPMGAAKMKFTFGAKSSTSGRLMPEYFIKKYTGKVPKEFFDPAINYSGAHDKTIELVAAGTYQVGAVNFTKYDQMLAKGELDPRVCKIIWKTPTYSDYNFTAHPILEERYGKGFTEKLQQALLEMTDEKLLDAFPRKKLIPCTNEDFEDIRQVAEQSQDLRLER